MLFRHRQAAAVRLIPAGIRPRSSAAPVHRPRQPRPTLSPPVHVCARRPCPPGRRPHPLRPAAASGLRAHSPPTRPPRPAAAPDLVPASPSPRPSAVTARPPRPAAAPGLIPASPRLFAHPRRRLASFKARKWLDRHFDIETRRRKKEDVPASIAVFGGGARRSVPRTDAPYLLCSLCCGKETQN